MKSRILPCGPIAKVIAFVLLTGAARVTADGAALAGKEVAEPSFPYGIGSWAEELGNHRVIIHVKEAAPAIWARLPWRRSDANPEKKDVVVIDAKTGKPVRNRVVVQINRETGDLVFQPVTVPGDYYVYYLPNQPNRGAFPSTTYLQPKETAEVAWVHSQGLTRTQLAAGKWKLLPQATVLEFQARGEFHRFDPMEFIATAEETRNLVSKHPGRAMLLFPEDRKYPIRMTDDLPCRWIRSGPAAAFQGQAQPGEYYVFQVGVYGVQPLTNLEAEYGPLHCGDRTIPASEFRSINLGGNDWMGRPFRKNVSVEKGKVQALWFGVQVPRDAPPGDFRGKLAIKAAGVEPSQVEVTLHLAGPVLEDAGDGDLVRLTRLRWLDSTLAVDDDPVPPFTRLIVAGKQVEMLGRRILFGSAGLPASISTTFPATLDRTDGSPREVLASPVQFVVETAHGPVAWNSQATRLLSRAPGAAEQQTESTAGPLNMSCWSKTECDGYTNYRITLTAREATSVKDLRLEIPLRRDVAQYLLGMGRKGGLRPKELRWKWGVDRHQDAVWIGDVNAGVQLKFKGPDYTWPNVNIHYRARPLKMPDAWHNNGRGGCDVVEVGADTVLVRAYAGPRELQAGQTLHFHLGMLVTPIKPIQPAQHFASRYYHTGGDTSIQAAAVAGANVVNLHQGGALNPYINYPFRTTDKLGAWIAEAHRRGMRAKIYYTLRELSNFTAELPALRSLGGEIYSDGPGGGSAWLMEHLRSHYKPAWHEWLPNGDVDASIATAGLSRWHNYYIESLAWLCRNVKLDGLYLDDVGYDREIMKRVRKVLLRNNPRALIDLHSWNHFNGMACFANSANLYLEHMPYVDRLWFGEGFDYNREPPDYWLVEISGLPFGLMGEMLEGGGNPWRGMVYGMTSRLGWSGDPRPLWKLWDDFGIAEARMIGYWDKSCPVKSARDDIPVTIYRKSGKTLVAVASWSGKREAIRLAVDWRALGLDPSKASFFAPRIDGFQREAAFAPTAAIPVAPGKGWLLVLDETPRTISGPPSDDPLKGLAVKAADETPFEINVPANTVKTKDIAWQKDATVAVARIDPRRDAGQSWGIGLAVGWASGRYVQTNARTDNRWGLRKNGAELFAGDHAPGKPATLAVKIGDKTVQLYAKEDGAPEWELLTEFPRAEFPGTPSTIRVGKVGAIWSPKDFADPGEACPCRVEWVKQY